MSYQPKPKHATQSVEAIAEILHRRLSDFGTQLELEVWHRGPEFQDLLINLLEKIHEEEKEKYFWLYLKLAKTLEQGDTVQIKDKSWDAKGLREKAVQLDPLRAYKRMLKDAVKDPRDGKKKFDIGQETLDGSQLLKRTIEASPDYASLYWHLANEVNLQKVAQLFRQDGRARLGERLEAGTMTIHGETINEEIAGYLCEFVLGPTECPDLPNLLGVRAADAGRRGFRWKEKGRVDCVSFMSNQAFLPAPTWEPL